MPNTSEILEARHTLLEKYLRGELTQIVRAPGTITRRALGRALRRSLMGRSKFGSSPN